VPLAQLEPVLVAESAALGYRLLCGFDRWAVKTLQDRPALLRLRTATIRYLVTRRAPRVLPRTRLAFERRVFRVTAAVTLLRQEDDGDTSAPAGSAGPVLAVA
jgi:hypothetical protein